MRLAIALVLTCWLASAGVAAEAANGLDPLIWLAESSHCGRTHVYTKEVMAPIEAVASGSVAKLPEIDLSETYLKSAGELARKRAAFAARRLARILADNL